MAYVKEKKRNKSSAVAEMGDRLATIDIGRKVGAAVPLSVATIHQCYRQTDRQDNGPAA